MQNSEQKETLTKLMAQWYIEQVLFNEERIKIEVLSKAGIKPKEIDQLLGGRSERTIYRELKQGTVELLNSDLTVRKEYSANWPSKSMTIKEQPKDRE